MDPCSLWKKWRQPVASQGQMLSAVAFPPCATGNHRAHPRCADETVRWRINKDHSNTLRKMAEFLITSSSELQSGFALAACLCPGPSSIQYSDCRFSLVCCLQTETRLDDGSLGLFSTDVCPTGSLRLIWAHLVFQIRWIVVWSRKMDLRGPAHQAVNSWMRGGKEKKL